MLKNVFLFLGVEWNCFTVGWICLKQMIHDIKRIADSCALTQNDWKSSQNYYLYSNLQSGQYFWHQSRLLQKDAGIEQNESSFTNKICGRNFWHSVKQRIYRSEKEKEQNKLEHTRRRHKAINLFLKEITLQLKSLCKVKKKNQVNYFYNQQTSIYQ